VRTLFDVVAADRVQGQQVRNRSQEPQPRWLRELADEEREDTPEFGQDPFEVLEEIDSHAPLPAASG
jgi:hypothetical protein